MMTPDPRMTVQIRDGAAGRLDTALAASLPVSMGFSRARISKLIRAGSVAREGVVIKDCATRARAGEVYDLQPPPVRKSTVAPENIPLDIVHEDGDVLIINKTAGMVVHPAPGNRHGTLLNAVLHHCRLAWPATGASEAPGLVHRLDKDTTGLLVVARTERAMMELTAQFADRSAGRVYTAIVRGDIRTLGTRSVRDVTIAVTAGGTFRLAGAIGRDRNNRLRNAVLASGGKRAVTHVESLEPLAAGTCSHVRCHLETGRTHQIRVHLAHLGHPLIGDRIYGAGATTLPQHVSQAMQDAVQAFPRQALHAGQLSFDHPASGKRMTFTAALPNDMIALLAALQHDSNGTSFQTKT